MKKLPLFKHPAPWGLVERGRAVDANGEEFGVNTTEWLEYVRLHRVNPQPEVSRLVREFENVLSQNWTEDVLFHVAWVQDTRADYIKGLVKELNEVFASAKIEFEGGGRFRFTRR